MGPRLLAQHFVPFQAGLVRLPEGITCPPDPHVLQQTEVADLVTHQGVIENVRSLFVIGFDAPEKENKQSLQQCQRLLLRVQTIYFNSLPLEIKILFWFFNFTRQKFTKALPQGNLPNVVWIFGLKIFHQGSD